MRFLSDFDSPWKDILDSYFELFLAFFFPTAHGDIDWSRGYEILDNELQQLQRDADIGERRVDKLIKVWRQSGDEEWVLVHVEIQSQDESEFARRMYVYNYRLFDRYNRQVASLAVLADDRRNWRPDHFGYNLWGCEIGIRFPVVKLLDFSNEAELEASANPFAMVVLAHLKTLETRQNAESRHDWKIRLVRRLYEKGLGRKEIVGLFRFIDWVMNLPPDLDRLFWTEVQELEEGKRMPYLTSFERRAEERGREEGRRLGLLAAVQAILKGKFGEPGLALLPHIERLASVEKLQLLCQSLGTASNLDDVRKFLDEA